MTMKIINKVDPATLDQLKDWCKSKVGICERDRSSYVGDRLTLWISHKVDFRNGKVSAGYRDDGLRPASLRITKFCQKVYPGCDIGLLSIHIDGISNGIIKPHRDHGYGQPIARGVNLGNCVFGCDGKDYELGDGDITEFNCKKIHEVKQILTPERFSITLWKFNKGYLPV